MNILVTGGAGYIGSHTCLELLQQDLGVVVIDNLSNSSQESLRRVEELTGKQLKFYRGDVRDEALLEQIFRENAIDCVIHFAGLKAVGESVAKPWWYYDHNLNATLTLTKTMEAAGIKKLIFSSSATVYTAGNEMPLREDSPIGAHESGRIGEDPRGIPNNLMPYITQVAVGRRQQLSVFGNDYPTNDGTGVRDYIHVVDLAKGHVAAVDFALQHPGCEVFNLGTGTGYSVLDMVHTFAAVNQVAVPYVIAPRRAGDVAICYADPGKSAQLLHWHAEKDLADMCRDSWRWQHQNPMGYEA